MTNEPNTSVTGPDATAPGGVKSAVRTLQLLEALAARDGTHVRLRDLAEDIDAPRSSTHALLRTLCAQGWVRTDPTGTLYALGLRPLLVGTAFLDTDPFVRAAGPVLSAVRDELQETVHLARLDGHRVVYLSTLESGREVRRILRVGRWLPAHSTSLGKAILAARNEVPDAADLVPVTDQTLTDPAALAADLEETRARGYGIDVEENTPGLSCVGVALRYSDPVTDAISCSVPLSRMNPARRKEIARVLFAARDQLEDTVPVRGIF